MRYITFLLVLVLSVAGRAQTSDVHGTWTAEIHSGRVNLQVRTSPPPDWTRNGNWNSDWSMGQTFPVEDLSGLPNSDTFTLAAAKFDLRREAGSLAFEG